MLTEKTEEALRLVKDCLEGTDFSDLKRIQDLINETRNDFDESIIPSGHTYSAIRAGCRINKSLATEEIWNGLSQLFTLHSLPEPKELSKKFVSMLQAMKDGGAILHITADAESLKTAVPLIKDFASYAKLNSLKPKAEVPDEKFFELTNIKPDSIIDNSNTEIFVTNCEVGFTGVILPAHKWLSKESAAEAVLAHYLSTTILWEELRTIGGAYGAFASSDPVEETFALSSYRDPTPIKSLDTFIECLKKCAEIDFDEETLEKCIVGCYSKEIQPKSPSNRGFTGFLRLFWGITEEDRAKKISLLFSLTTKDIKNAINNLINQSTRINVCITNSDINSRGKVIKLPM